MSRRRTVSASSTLYERTPRRRRRVPSSSTTFERVPRRRLRTWREWIGQSALGVAGASLGFMEAGLPGAVIRGGQVYEAAAPNLEDGYDYKVVGKKEMSTYAGKFNSMPIAKGSEEDVRSYFGEKGALVHAEIFGRTSDADCVYVGHSTYHAGQYPYAIGAAIVRKLLKKAGFNPTSTTEVIPLMNAVSAGQSCLRMNYTLKKTDGTFEDFYYNIPQTATVQSIVLLSQLGNNIHNFMQFTTDATISKNYSLDHVYLRAIVGDPIPEGGGVLLASLNMQNEHLELYSHSTIMLQNRTLAVNGSSDTNQVGACPLQGTKYLMKGAVPSAKQKNSFKIDTIYAQGVLLVRAEQLPGECWKEPVPPHEFNNLLSASKVRLEPGQMKKSKISYTVKGTFEQVMQKLAARNHADGPLPFDFVRGPGRCEMFALEEVMETGALQFIDVAYEKQHTTGCILTTDSRAIMLHDYGKLEINNLA